MVRTFFDLKAEEKINPRPADLKDDEPWNPLSPRPEVIKAHAEVNFPYETTVHDRALSQWYALVKARPQKVTQEITQFYRIRIPQQGEYMFYNVVLRGEDWKGNEHDAALLKGRYQMPIFKRDIDPATDKVTTSEIKDHRTVYDIKWSPEHFDKLMESAVDPVSLVLYGSAGRRLGILSIDDFRNGTFDDLLQVGLKGKSLEAVVAEKNQFTYEKREPKPGKHT